MYDLTPLINEIIKVMAAIMSVFLIPLLIDIIGESKRRKVAYWLEVAVTAVEEDFKDKGSGQGEEKQAAVLAYLNEKGVKLDQKEIIMLIKSTVWRLINSFKGDK